MTKDQRLSIEIDLCPLVHSIPLQSLVYPRFQVLLGLPDRLNLIFGKSRAVGHASRQGARPCILGNREVPEMLNRRCNGAL